MAIFKTEVLTHMGQINLRSNISTINGMTEEVFIVDPYCPIQSFIVEDSSETHAYITGTFKISERYDEQ